MKLGWSVLLAWLAGLAACLAVAWLFGLPELAALAIATGAALGISAALLRLAKPPAVTAAIEPSTCNRGERATLRLSFSAPPGERSTPARLWGRLGTAGDGIVAVAGLGAGETTSVAVGLPTPARGIVRVSKLRIRTNDPLRLFHTECDADCEADLLVRPEVHQLPEDAGSGGRRSTPGRRRGSGPPSLQSDSELVGLRPYVRGDDVRRIHWRTSARLGEPHVVQVEPPVRSPATTVLLDQRPDSTAEGFERAVSAAASVLVAAATAGRSVRLVTRGSDGDVIDSEPTPPADVGDLLDTLATVSRLSGGLGGSPEVGGADEDTLVWCTATTATQLEVPEGVDTVVTCAGGTGEQFTARLGTDQARLVAWNADTSLAEAWLASGTAEQPA